MKNRSESQVNPWKTLGTLFITSESLKEKILKERWVPNVKSIFSPGLYMLNVNIVSLVLA